MLPRPTTEFWRILQEASSDATRRGHHHVGSEHLLYALASTANSFTRSFLEHLDLADPIKQRLDELMTQTSYERASSNAVMDENGNLIGHLYIGPTGEPFFQSVDVADA